MREHQSAELLTLKVQVAEKAKSLKDIADRAILASEVVKTQADGLAETNTRLEEAIAKRSSLEADQRFREEEVRRLNALVKSGSEDLENTRQQSREQHGQLRLKV